MFRLDDLTLLRSNYTREEPKKIPPGTYPKEKNTLNIEKDRFDPSRTPEGTQIIDDPED
jgi:hypothetical protein